MADNKLSEMISSSLESIRAIADSGTVVGDPIPTNNGTVIIPVSKISVGFASGGLDYLPKNGDKKTDVPQPGKLPAKGTTPCFGGGGGTGISVTPVCFIAVDKDGNVTMLNIGGGAASVPPAVGVVDSVASFADRLPDLIERFKAVFAKKKPEDRADDQTLEEELAPLRAEVEDLEKELKTLTDSE